MNQLNENNILEKIIENYQIQSPLKQYLLTFYHLLTETKEIQLKQIITIPFQQLLTEQNETIQLLLTPIYHIILNNLLSHQEETELQNIINETFDGSDEQFIEYFNRYDLSTKTIPSLSSYSFPSTETMQTIQSAISLLDNTIPIELNYETFEERRKYYGIFQKKHISTIFGRNYLYFNQNDENSEKEINLETTKDGAPLMENDGYAIDLLDSIRFHNSVVIGLSEKSSFSFSDDIDLDVSSIGIFLGNCLKGCCSTIQLPDIYKIMAIPNDRLQASLIIGLMIAFKHTNNKSIIDILKVISDPSLHGSPSLLIQSLALIAIGIISQSSSPIEIEEMIISHICSPMTNAFIGFHHIWSACISLGCLRFGKQLTTKQFEIIQKVMNGCSYDSLRKYTEKIDYSQSHDYSDLRKNGNGSVYRNNMISTFVGVPSACLCFGLSYFNTNDETVLSILQIENDLQTIGNTPPDDLLIKVIARSLIQFTEIQPTNQWIYSNVPTCLRQHRFASFDIINAKFALVTGACYSLGLKYIGTLHEEVKRLLLQFVEKLKTSIEGVCKKQNERARKNLVYFERYLLIILLSLCMIMCGSKDTEIMNILEWIESLLYENQSFGSYQMISTCIGLLNAGKGEYSINPSSENIPIYIMSFYPLFEQNFDDTFIYPSYLHHLGVSCLTKRLFHGFNHSINQYEEMKIDIVFNEMGKQLYNQQQITVTFPTIIPPPQFIECLIPHGKMYLYQQLSLDEIENDCIIRVVYAPVLDKYGILPELLVYNQQMKKTNDVYINQMNAIVDKTFKWIRTKIISHNYTEEEFQLITILLNALQQSDDIAIKIKCEALLQLL